LLLTLHTGRILLSLYPLGFIVMASSFADITMTSLVYYSDTCHAQTLNDALLQSDLSSTLLLSLTPHPFPHSRLHMHSSPSYLHAANMPSISSTTELIVGRSCGSCAHIRSTRLIGSGPQCLRRPASDGRLCFCPTAS